MMRVFGWATVVALGTSSLATAADVHRSEMLSLDAAQIDEDTWQHTYTDPSPASLFGGDTFIYELSFTGSQNVLHLIDFDLLELSTTAAVGAQYELNFELVLIDGLSELTLESSFSSDAAGNGGGLFGLGSPIAEVFVDRVRVELEITSGQTALDSVTVGLAGASVTIIPEPALCLWVLGGGVLLMARRCGRSKPERRF